MKKEKKLQLKKINVQDLNAVLNSKEQKTVNGGTKAVPRGVTVIPIFCS